MTETTNTPRRVVETDPIRALAGQLAALRKEVARLGKTATLRNSSVSDTSGTVRLRFAPEEGALIAYAEDGAEAARFGVLANTDPGLAGVEVLSGGGWIRVGDGAALEALDARVEALETSVASLQDEAGTRDTLIQELDARLLALEGV